MSAREPSRLHHQIHPPAYRGIESEGHEASADEVAAEWLRRLEAALKRLDSTRGRRPRDDR